jgi:hypothetical protein
MTTVKPAANGDTLFLNCSHVDHDPEDADTIEYMANARRFGSVLSVRGDREATDSNYNKGRIRVRS